MSLLIISFSFIAYRKYRNCKQKGTCLIKIQSLTTQVVVSLKLMFAIFIYRAYWEPGQLSSIALGYGLDDRRFQSR